MLRIEMMPAERGDALLVEYGPGVAGDVASHRVLIDGGPVNGGIYEGVRDRLSDVPVDADGRRHFDLLIVTHVDADHVEGVVRLLQDDELRCVFDDIWFNGWKHLQQVAPEETLAVLGGTQGEFLGALLVHAGRPWNQYVRGGPVFVPDEDELPVVVLRGGLKLTVLSPTVKKLKALASDWDASVRNAGFTPGDPDAAMEQLAGRWWARPPVLGDDDRIRASSDRSAANGSSIAVLAEYDGQSLLLTGDAHDDVLTASLRRLRGERNEDGPLRVGGVKLSHHGSQNNTSVQLLAEVATDRYLVSSSGDRFDHPDAGVIRRIIKHHEGGAAPAILCNYEQPQTTLWDGIPGIDVLFGEDAVLNLPLA